MAAGRSDLLEARDRTIAEVNHRGQKILGAVVRNTRHFHKPDLFGPRGPTHKSDPKSLRIATVSNRLMAPLGVSDEDDFEVFEFDRHMAPLLKSESQWAQRFRGLSASNFANVSMLQLKASFDIEQYRTEFLSHVHRAIEDGADAICFAELAYPHPGCVIDEYPAHVAFETELQRLADEHDILIIAGSYHCLARQTNECVIFLKQDRNKDGEIDPLKEPTSPREYTKRSPALKMGEVVRRPIGTAYPFYRATFGAFSVLICLDSFDPTLFLRYMYWHAAAAINGNDKREVQPERVDVIFVPSYSENKHGFSIAKDLSYVSQAIVVYVDATIHKLCSAIAVCGRKLENHADHNQLTQHGEYCLRELNFKSFRDDQRELIENQEKSAFFRSLILDDGPPSDPTTVER